MSSSKLNPLYQLHIIVSINTHTKYKQNIYNKVLALFTEVEQLKINIHYPLPRQLRVLNELFPSRGNTGSFSFSTENTGYRIERKEVTLIVLK